MYTNYYFNIKIVKFPNIHTEEESFVFGSSSSLTSVSELDSSISQEAALVVSITDSFSGINKATTTTTTATATTTTTNLNEQFPRPGADMSGHLLKWTTLLNGYRNREN